MKTLNAKRIATIVAGAALLGLGAAFAGPITIGNIPIISASGQPLVQIVIGSSAQPIDGVSAGNIAAAIGNLAYASVPVTATVNQSQAASVLKVSVSSSKGATVTNQQVWLNESGSTSTSGSFQFGALIGSVLNGAIILSSLQYTKQLQSGTGTQYAYQESNSLTLSPAASPYSTVNYVPVSNPPLASSNGGGITFSTFQAGTTFDNVMEITNAQLPALLSNYGGSGETEILWLTGFPVYNQQSGVNQFQLLSSGGAYQVTFNKPIFWLTGSGAKNINVPIQLLKTNWTIINETPPGKTIGSQNFVNGGQLFLATSLATIQTVYVGQNITAAPFKVQLTDLGQPNTGGVSQASINVYYNNLLTNTSQIYPGNTQKFNISGQTLYVNVNSTFAGLYAYQKWAKMQLYSNVYKIQDGKVFNQTTNPGWQVKLLWTNTTSTTAQNANSLQSIILFNTSATSLNPGQSFNFVQNPVAYKLTFIGDQLGSGNFDTVTATTSQTSSLQYQNLGTGGGVGYPNPTNITEPAQLLTVTSGIPNAFSYAGQSSGSVQYLLTPYQLVEQNNAAGVTAPTNTQIALVYTSNTGATWITSTYQLTGTVSGWPTSSATSAVSAPFAFSGNSATTGNIVTTTQLFYNITAITLNNKALPGTGFSIEVIEANAVTNAPLATLTTYTPGILYTIAGKAWQGINLGNVIYNQQNGQPTSTFLLKQLANPLNVAGQVGNYFTYSMGEIAVPTNTAAVDYMSFQLMNSTSGIQALGSSPIFQLNYSLSGTKNNVTYTSTIGTLINAPPGFRTERGSKVAIISPNTDTFSIAKTVDTLQFAVATAATAISGKSYKLWGPYGVGQATNIANVSIGKVNATVILAPGATYNITGIGNIQAIPSVSSATTPVLLKSLSGSAPLVVLDSQAAATPQSNYILIGSGFVNSLSQQLQVSQNITFTPSSQPIAQAYGTNRILIAGFYGNQTQAAADNFINQLYAQATV